jgi:hypothetical protein
MASKNKNPYREGCAYAKIFAYIQKENGVVTRAGLLKKGFSVSDVTVVLSPRAEGSSKRGGDVRGNLSAQGHIYYMEKLKKEVGEVQRFRLRWRKTPLAKHVRPPVKEVESQKTPKVEAPVELVEAVATVEAPVETIETPTETV